MKTSIAALLAALAVGVAGPAAAQSLDDWYAFLDESWARYGSDQRPLDWEDHLFLAGEANQEDPEAAMAAFAAAIEKPVEIARGYARTIMALNELRVRCGDDPCAADEWSASLASLIEQASAEPSGELLLVLGKSSLPATQHAQLMNAVMAHPGRTKVLSGLYDYTEDGSYLALLVLEEPGARPLLDALRETPPRFQGDPDQRNGWVLSVLEQGRIALSDAGASAEDQAVYVQPVLAQYLSLGLTQDAVGIWKDLSPAVRAVLPLAPSVDCGAPTTPNARASDEEPYCRLREASTAFSDEMAAALWLDGDHAAARELLARSEEHLGGRMRMGQLHAAVVDAMDREQSDQALFNLYVDGDGALPKKRYASATESGWLAQSYGPASRRLVSQRASDAGYPSIADAIADRPIYYRSEYGDSSLTGMAESLPLAVRDRQTALAPKIEAAWAAAPQPEGERAMGPVVIPSVWVESRLPDGIPPWKAPSRGSHSDDCADGVDCDGLGDAACAALAAAMAAADAAMNADDDAEVYDAEPFDCDENSAACAAAAAAEAIAVTEEAAEGHDEPTEDLPVSGYAVVRLEDVDGERTMVYRSAMYDLPGETGAYGLWFDRTTNGVWGSPIYLGLQENFPYVVAPQSELPLLNGDLLQIEVQVREIDPASITFPPVGLRLLREEDGLVLSANLSDLTHDRDGDGIPDLVEDRLGLDAGNPDMDGDGSLDGSDPVPQVAWDPAAHAGRNALARAILHQMTGFDEGALVVGVASEDNDPLSTALGSAPVSELRNTIIIGGDPTLFAGMNPPFRLLAYTPEALEALGGRGAPFYPPTVEVHSSLDGKRHYVIWSASWVGGSFVATCEDGATTCEIDERSSWIT